MWGWAQNQLNTFDRPLKDAENQGASAMCLSVPPPARSVVLVTCNPVQSPIAWDSVQPKMQMYLHDRLFCYSWKRCFPGPNVGSYPVWQNPCLPLKFRHNPNIFLFARQALWLMWEEFSLLVEEAFLGNMLFAFRHAGASWRVWAPDIVRYRLSQLPLRNVFWLSGYLGATINSIQFKLTCKQNIYSQNTNQKTQSQMSMKDIV